MGCVAGRIGAPGNPREGLLTTMILAALGGCWWPIEITPPWMQSLSLALPTGWAMDALHRLVHFGYGAGAAGPHVAALSLGAIVAGWAGALRALPPFAVTAR